MRLALGRALAGELDDAARRRERLDAGSAQLGGLALLIAGQLGFGLLLEQHLIRGVMHDLGRAGNAILSQIQICHVYIYLFLYTFG